MRHFTLLSCGLLLLALVARCTALAFLVFDAHDSRPGEIPSGWRLHVNSGSPEISIINDSRGSVLHLRSRASSFALERSLDVDAERFPYLTWNWKVTELPRGGDFRHASTDDQAAQLLVAFGNRHILEYVWDSTAPQDTSGPTGGFPLLHIFVNVCRSGPAGLNRWLPEVRNVAADYARAFGHPPIQHVTGIRIQINSQHTSTSAESYFGDVAFRSMMP